MVDSVCAIFQPTEEQLELLFIEMFVGVSNEGEAFGISLEEIDKTKNLIARINDRHVFPHARVQYMMYSVDENAEHFVLAANCERMGRKACRRQITEMTSGLSTRQNMAVKLKLR